MDISGNFDKAGKFQLLIFLAFVNFTAAVSLLYQKSDGFFS